MNYRKLSIAALFLTTSGTLFYAQQKNDTVKNEKNIEGVVIQGSTNKKTETAVLFDQKKAIIQKQAISAEEISRKGISNVEQGLTKVTGITTVDGRGLFVRGLEERYNYLLINGLGSPSNNPFQKIIALKQFPTDVVGKLNIYKTFNSNLYGDFAGATFDIETLTMDRAFSKVEFGVGVNTISNLRNNFFISENATGIKGYLGLNSKDRQLPDNLDGVRPSNYRFNSEESKRYFKDSWNVDEVRSMPNTSIGFTTAQKIKAGENGNIGILFSLNQSSKFAFREGAKNQFLDNGGQSIVLNNKLNRKQYNFESESSALMGFGYKNRKTQINLNAIYLQSANNIIEDYFGYKNQQVQNEDIGFFRVNQLDISRFLDLQLTGSHKINDRQSIKAGGSYVLNDYQQPDRKIMEGSRQDNLGNILNDNQLLITYGGNNIIRQYLDVNSRFYGSAFGEYNIAFGEKGDRKDYPVQLSIGYNGFADLRRTSYRFIFGKPNGTAGQNFIIDRNKPQQGFDQDMANNLFFFQEESDAYQSFTSIYQFVNAGYANINYKPNDSWDILLGARYENDLSLIRFNPQGQQKTENIEKDRNMFLPSLAIKKAVNDRNNLRLAFSKTITRPVLIETMAIPYINPDNETILGNPNILNSENYNIDLKWEYFPTRKEMFSVNLFAKRIDNAIERSFTTSGNSNGVTVTFFNAKKADLYGFELEGIVDLARISESLNNFTFGANATIMHTNVERSTDQLALEKPNGFTDDQLRKRGLQGAAPYTINADLKYEFKKQNSLPRTLSLVYNVSGSKIFAVGTSGTDNFYERPFHQLDFVYQEQITKNWNIKFGVQNILNTQYRIELGDSSYYNVNTNNNFQYTNYYRGTTFNFTVGYTF
ncbi:MULTISPECIES: outer membrane beta-barrel protein [Chryseobacterium]|uniref:Outer membrane receptor for ferrienterochelin and colicins n=1 Tax=Chryseobacterium taihuense TaxID=1141221 RepID=A0A4U8WQU6_9FLAO|nr:MULTISPECIES: outer membrane beta-barrel protein [Chryseobacterium]QQV01425.1 TonB-dependent receptor [Chryseobacterium sp. FDAARGOS 1104]VFB05388.1 Outer membrane receptor for ferrienterochelin and colicins [Chryseobacterium taihuense]